ncbi:hypothetical protein TIFTF001_010611 [Ficus carica]|uniref:Uncharacterized protein n=1 Tax=Ficus carica TaxID=3494 RepID=A0AA88D262_FICCA|nr:hypothetical protein TIFTF001_010611 [Ficus carica]
MNHRNPKLVANFIRKATKESIRYYDRDRAQQTGNQHLRQHRLGCFAHRVQHLAQSDAGARVVLRQAVGDGSEQEAGVGGEPGLEVVGMAEEAVVDVFGVEERDVDAGVGEELGELEHARHVSLRRKGNMRTRGGGGGGGGVGGGRRSGCAVFCCWC